MLWNIVVTERSGRNSLPNQWTSFGTILGLTAEEVKFQLLKIIADFNANGHSGQVITSWKATLRAVNG